MKNIVNKPKIGAGLSALAFSLIITADVQAQSCTTVPTCEELGYTKSVADCGENDKLRCPFDNTLFFCPAGGGATSLTVGDILFSDMTTSPNPVTGKTPIGVVFNTTNRLAVGLTHSKMDWSENSTDMCSSFTGPTFATLDKAAADFDGKNNTSKILTYCKQNNLNCKAAQYANSYTTAGTNAGDWYLPSAGELNALSAVRGFLNLSLAKINGSQILSSDARYGSSTLTSECNYLWGFNMEAGTIAKTSVGYASGIYVRPVLAF